MREIRHGDVTIFEDRPVVLPAVLAATAVVFAIGLTLHVPALLAGEKEAIGIVLGLLLSAFGAVLLFRRDRFAFDAAAGRVRWRKWSLARASSGELEFSDILDVTMESTSGAEGGGSYRVSLRTKGGTVPLTETYAGDADRWRPVAARIREILGLADNSGIGADTESLLAQGRRIDAVRQVRETEGLSLGEAKARIDSFGSRTD